MIKKCYFLLFLFGICITFNSCINDKNIPNNYINKNEYYDNSFQDYTDYCKYYYKNNSDFANNSVYHNIDDSEISDIKGYFENFSEFVKNKESYKYDFDTNIITDDDYVLIETKEGEKIGDSVYEKYDNYSVYYFDNQANILYYIHNNI